MKFFLGLAAIVVVGLGLSSCAKDNDAAADRIEKDEFTKNLIGKWELYAVREDGYFQEISDNYYSTWKGSYLQFNVDGTLSTDQGHFDENGDHVPAMWDGYLTWKVKEISSSHWGGGVGSAYDVRFTGNDMQGYFVAEASVQFVDFDNKIVDGIANYSYPDQLIIYRNLYVRGK
jgi:hypothetical protein